MKTCQHNISINCTCPKECPRHGKCCLCVAHHREHGKLPHCLRGMDEQKKEEKSRGENIVTGE